MKNLTNKMVTIEGVAILFYGIVYSLPKPYRHQPMGSGNSNALAMQEFTTKARCEAAGKAAKKLTNNSVKFIEYTCTEK